MTPTENRGEDEAGTENGEGEPADVAPPAPTRGVSRRGLLGLVSAGAAGIAAGAAGGIGFASTTQTTSAGASATTYPFYGEHQAGITTPAQDRLHFAAFSVSSTLDRDGLIELLSDWTAAAARLTQGLDVSETGALGGSDVAPPTTRRGPRPPRERPHPHVRLRPRPVRGRRRRRPLRHRLPPPAGARPTPPVRRRRPAAGVERRGPLHPGVRRRSSGRRARDPQPQQDRLRSRLPRVVAARLRPHVVHVDGAEDAAEPLRLQGRHGEPQARGPRGRRRAGVGRHRRRRVDERRQLPRDPQDPHGHRGVDRQQRLEQERVIGRSKGEGAPLSGGTEFTAPDFSATGAADEPLIDASSHVRLAHPDNLGGVRLLRRGYNYVDGNDALGSLDAGLFFISFQRSIDQFTTVQRALAGDALGEYLKHVGSAVFAVPPGARENGFVGETLFSS